MFQTELKNLPEEDISILIRPDNHAWNYLCECGQASLLTVKECQQVRAVFVSHTHFDHFVNFDNLIRHQIGIERRVIVCGPEHIGRQVRAKLQGYTWNLMAEGALEYEIREIATDRSISRFLLQPPHWELQELPPLPEGPIFENKDFRVDFTLLDHRIPTVAWKFSEPEKISIELKDSGLRGGPWISALKAAFLANEPEALIHIGEEELPAHKYFHLLNRKPGHSLGIIMDHAAHAENHARIRELFSGCDTVYIESFYLESDNDLADKNAHSWSKASGSIMRECKVREAIPVHFSRRYEKEEREQVKLEFTRAFAGEET